MRTYTMIDICLLMFLGLVFNLFVPFKTVEPDFLLAAFAVLVIPKHHWKVPLLTGAILVIFTVVHSWFSFPALLQALLSGVFVYFLAWLFRKHITHQGIFTGLICLVGTLAGGGISSLLSGESLKIFGYWAILTTLLAYTFYVSLDFSERIFTAQYRKS